MPRCLINLKHTPQTRLVDRIVHKEDFERLLTTRWCSRTTHFALHHLDSAPLPRVWVPKAGACTELSTEPAPIDPQTVDDSLVSSRGLWFGCVVPKRHAKRAVTRNLIKRQVRSAFERLGAELPYGLWLVRLKAPFSKTEFISARSTVLAVASRVELDALLQRIRS